MNKNTKKLFDGEFLGFNPEVATKLGQTKAVVLELLHSLGADGVSMSYRDINSLLPFLSSASIRRVMRELGEEEIVISSNGNSRVNHYKINLKKLESMGFKIRNHSEKVDI